MSTLDFKELSRQLHSELSHISIWRKFVRVLSTAVYIFVFCWLMFVLFGSLLLSKLGSDFYSQIMQYIAPAFIGFVVVNFIFSYSMMAFQKREAGAMNRIMSILFPSVRYSPTSQVENKILMGSKLFGSSFSDSAMTASTYGTIEISQNEHSLHVADIGVSHGMLNKLQGAYVLGYFVLIYRAVLRPLFASRLDSSAHNFRGMFGWCQTSRQIKGNVIILPDHLEQKIGYLAKNIQGLKKHYNTHLIQLEDQEFENLFSVYADDEVEARIVLTPAMMRHITTLRQTFGHDMMLSFSRDSFYYAAAMPNGFLSLRPSTLKDGKLLEEIYNDISLACKVTDDLRIK